MYNEQQAMEEVVEMLTKALIKLNAVNHDGRTRELSVSITEIETGLMWLNKDRANRGYLPASPTHVKND